MKRVETKTDFLSLGFDSEEEYSNWCGEQEARAAMEREMEEFVDPYTFGDYQLRLISFVSRSRGKDDEGNRIPRRPREVEMIRVNNVGVLPVIRGEIRTPKRKRYLIKPDELAEEVLGEGATTSDLYYEIRRRQFGY